MSRQHLSQDDRSEILVREIAPRFIRQTETAIVETSTPSTGHNFKLHYYRTCQISDRAVQGVAPGRGWWSPPHAPHRAGQRRLQLSSTTNSGSRSAYLA